MATKSFKNEAVRKLHDLYEAGDVNDKSNMRAWMRKLLDSRPQSTQSATHGFERLDRIQAILALPASMDSKLVLRELRKQGLYSATEAPAHGIRFIERVRASPKLAMTWHKRTRRSAVVE